MHRRITLPNKKSNAYRKANVTVSDPFLPQIHITAKAADLPILSDLLGLCA